MPLPLPLLMRRGGVRTPLADRRLDRQKEPAGDFLWPLLRLTLLARRWIRHRRRHRRRSCRRRWKQQKQNQDSETAQGDRTVRMPGKMDDGLAFSVPQLESRALPSKPSSSLEEKTGPWWMYCALLAVALVFGGV